MHGASHLADLAHDLVLTGQGDRPAFRRLYGATAPKLLRICLSVTRDRAAAEDVLQDVYVKVWRSAAAYDPTRSSAFSWLGTIARNRAIDWYRSNMKPPLAAEAAAFSMSSEAEPVDLRIIREHAEDAALSMVGELEADEEDQLRTIYFQGLTYAALAERDGLSLGTVKSRVRRVLTKLRRKLNDD